jgi:hypothetical protein
MKNDFKSEDLVKVKAAINHLLAHIEQPNKFAELFCEAARKQKDIDHTLKITITNLIAHDKDARALMKGLIREIETEDWKFFLQKIGTTGIAVGSLITGVFLTALFGYFFK